MEYGATMKQINCIRYFGTLQADSAHMCFGLEFPFNTVQTCSFIYKYTYLPNLLPTSFKEYFKTNSQVHHYNTRQSDNLHPPLSRTTHSQFSIKHRGSSLWNTHILIANSSSSLRIFKHRLRASLLSQASPLL